MSPSTIELDLSGEEFKHVFTGEFGVPSDRGCPDFRLETAAVEEMSRRRLSPAVADYVWMTV